MTQSYFGEKWKKIEFGDEYTNFGRIEVSNFGRLRSFNKVSDGNIIKGAMLNGYKNLALKLYHPRDEKTENKIEQMKKEVLKLGVKLRSLKKEQASQLQITEATKLFEKSQKDLRKKIKDDLKSRTVNYHSLVHRLVADYFLNKPSTGQTIVAHMDHDKMNNSATNLKWMTPEQNYEHRSKSPEVLKAKQEQRDRRKENVKGTKLTVTKVMLLKKLLNEGKPIKQLVKQFKVTDTQILRIKRGENWADIGPAK